MPAQARTTTGLGGGAALGVLLACAPPPGAALGELATVSGTTDPTAPVVAAAALSAWALTAWLLLAVLLTVLGRAPGRVGRVAGRLARRWVPTAVRASLELALGLTVATGVLSAGTGHAAPSLPSASAARAAAPPLTADRAPLAPGDRMTSGQAFDLDWPAPTPAAAASTPARRLAEPPAARAEAVAPRGSPASVGTQAPPAAPPPARPGAIATPPTAPPPARPAVVVVQPGDTLWDLAAASLQRAGVPEPSDACIAQTWPRWWAANREVIGPDPDLILPGTPLSPPAGPVPGTPGS